MNRFLRTVSENLVIKLVIVSTDFLLFVSADGFINHTYPRFILFSFNNNHIQIKCMKLNGSR